MPATRKQVDESGKIEPKQNKELEDAKTHCRASAFHMTLK